MKTEIYLDNSATTKVCPEAAQKALDAMTVHYGNPSSLHTMGVEAEAMLSLARRQIAESLGCRKEEIILTSGGTEANNLALLGAARALRRRGKKIVTTLIEHASVAQSANALEKEGFEVCRLKPDQNGVIPEEAIRSAVTPDTILVSIMLVNNETGAIQPVRAARRAVRSVGAPALIHCDAVQAFGKISFTPAELGVDLLSVSGHKIHAPKGSGALYAAGGSRILPTLYGGGQERGMRSGTEALPAIAGFGEAARIAFEHFEENTGLMRELRSSFAERLKKLPFIRINSPENGAPHILNISVEGVRSEIMLHFLASKGIYVSSGSACGRGEKSRVLLAQGLPDERVDTALRLSFSRYNTPDEIEPLARALEEGEHMLEHVK